MKLHKYATKTLKILFVIFIIMNSIAFFHAYKFTHFNDSKAEKTKSPEKLSSLDKAKIVFFGVNNPKPKNVKFPSQKYLTLKLKSNKEIECWFIKTPNSKGTVILFHGYGGEKSLMIEKSDEFIKLGFSTMLVDFMGSGNSEGNQTTIGYKEAEEVKTTFDYMKQQGEKNIYLFGTSMGAVAIMKCINDDNIKPKGIIIECPFGSMYETVLARFKRVNAPTFPMASMLLFWGGIENGFWGFSHNPTVYAKSINSPTLLLYGEKDKSVSRKEIDEIYNNLKGSKKLNVYKNTGHENYLIKNKTEWVKNISDFTATIK
ncbi:alpha/beta hydrolase [Flavobacterium sp. ANB]|uniref:alpha/beta hydrolase n=1 Tax=unclassified Flavobacterium TaxID=196869 RepID=UPI0012B879C0|nr:MULTISPECIES: alpha/beta hydrolase [unclassified Flavobacterium]MBF4516265.1 alpha/beta hydrolase [Flavobacterium sp. ANB]MTD69838.1 prolyl oligopeptidase family serine peptidase [Flavobacterium sp. LC2016-13]